jgi:hypothetical protein
MLGDRNQRCLLIVPASSTRSKAAARIGPNSPVPRGPEQDAAGLALVTTAAEALDRIREAQAAIRKHGALVPDRYGALKQNPACFLERDARAGMLSALRALPLRDRGRSTVFDRK